MCEFCTKHGEGEKWYLNAKNYSDDLLSDIKRRKYIEDFFHNIYKIKKHYDVLKRLPLQIPIFGHIVRALVKCVEKETHWGQVIPIEDVETVLSMTSTIVRLPCACAHAFSGKIVRKCFGVCLNPETVDLVDQSYLGGPDVAKFEKMDKVEALNFMKEQETKGAFHSIWTLNTPFIGGICNCGKDNCISMGMHNKVTSVFFKAEYIMTLDKENCFGCKECIKICPFKALEYDEQNAKVKVNIKKCTGCGICRSVCQKDALKLKPRVSVPEAMNLW